MKTPRLANLRAQGEDGNLVRKIKAAIARIEKLEGRVGFLEAYVQVGKEVEDVPVIEILPEKEVKEDAKKEEAPGKPEGKKDPAPRKRPRAQADRKAKAPVRVDSRRKKTKK